MSRLGLGAANLGGVYGEVDEADAIRTVHRAFDLGINLFDRKSDAARDCKGSDSHCAPVQAAVSGTPHMYAALMAR